MTKTQASGPLGGADQPISATPFELAAGGRAVCRIAQDTQPVQGRRFCRDGQDRFIKKPMRRIVGRHIARTRPDPAQPATTEETKTN